MYVDEQGRIVYVAPKLYPKQLEFLNEKDENGKNKVTRYNGYGGARGGGKSYCIRPKAIQLALKYPGINILFVRRTLTELIENHLAYFEDELSAICKYDKKHYVFKFPNGSRIRLGYVNTESDMDMYKGQSIDAIFIDEATHFTEKMFMKFTQCLRLSDTIKKALGEGLTYIPRMYLTANPGGVGHYWYKRLFIDKQYKSDENPNDYRFVQSLVFDNEFLMKNDPAYVKALEALPEKEKKAMLYGDWDSFEGQMFPEFDEAKHVFDPNNVCIKGVVGKFKLEPNWRIYRARDYGLDRLAAIWCAIDENGTFWIYRICGESELGVSASGKKLNDMTQSHEVIYSDIAPPDMWNRNQQTGKSAADILRKECNQRLIKANNDREMGWLMVKELLMINTATGIPFIQISKNCTELIDCMKLIQRDEKNPNDCAKEPHNITHFPDALRYLCTSYTFKPDSIAMYSETHKFNFGEFALNEGAYAAEDNDNDADDGYIDMQDLNDEWW